jgi:hypothetical protein
MSPEASAVLRAVRDELDRHPKDVVGPLDLAGDVLSVFDGRMRLSAIVINDPGAHPSLAHAHVVADIGAPGFDTGGPAARFDACVVGIDADRGRALAGCARHWMAAAAGPLFSLLHAAPVLGAAHFDGSEPFGVAACHGFVGPMVARMFEKELDLSALQDARLFDYADALAPPGLVHLAKVTLEATDGGWNRTLAIDGHQAVHSDVNWDSGLVAPAHGLVSQFAVFHYGERPAAVEERRRVDDAIRQFVRAFHDTGNTDRAAEVLESRGVPAELVHRVAPFLPLALGRVIVGDMGPTFSPDFLRVRPDGGAERLRLMREPVFARSSALARELLSGELLEPAKALAFTGPEVNAINSALHAGSKPQNLVLSPAIVPERGVTPDVVNRAIAQLQQRPPSPGEPRAASRPARPIPAHPDRATKPAKPWWRFW